MRAKCSLTAIPWPLGNGENKKQLEYVLFVATNGIHTHKWSWTNTGNFIEDLSRIVYPGNATEIYSRLLRGEPVLFPWFFELDQIRHAIAGARNDGHAC